MLCAISTAAMDDLDGRLGVIAILCESKLGVVKEKEIPVLSSHGD